ncbi:uncharacterized protein LOC135955395 [Calliphora vicina]|uniref:uncharacterized protein LOC135955395 n=1 Tax=Calliphora vicina TaxID=7373 RepID=UPI00325AE5AB
MLEVLLYFYNLKKTAAEAHRLITEAYNERLPSVSTRDRWLLVIGPIQPITLADPIVWRSLICSYNIHVGNYQIPSTPLYPWDKWENFYVRSNQGRAHIKPDESREFLYLVLENYMNLSHGNGKECLLRSICENAQIHKHMDLFAEILNVILTPGYGDVDGIYGHAYEMGRAGADCFKYYSKCPPGFCFLDQFLHLS